ncbi:hypothetical protein [Caballeronia sp. ATUFL_F1_KS39]|uniref:hypothetical protein n=1 Tax=Caballeronia sp. ATUFL_F1_KS39 TaxID=2921766 RepID=UPI00202844E0|nr:hypothetical protein [Caballeronia sp. ATUFL_F1_KS39]
MVHRAIRELPPTMNDDLLERLQREVVGWGPDAAIPQNLSDEWLKILVKDALRGLYKTGTLNGEGLRTGPAMLAFAISMAQARLNKQNERKAASIYIQYRTALIEELLGRETGLYRRQYSLVDFYR